MHAPRYGEQTEAAAKRRLHEEMGLKCKLRKVSTLLTTSRCRTSSSNMNLTICLPGSAASTQSPTPMNTIAGNG